MGKGREEGREGRGEPSSKRTDSPRRRGVKRVPFSRYNEPSMPSMPLSPLLLARASLTLLVLPYRKGMRDNWASSGSANSNKLEFMRFLASELMANEAIS